MIIYGYPRVSTKKQSIERQIDNIKKSFPDAIIVPETYTGTSTDRPQWNKLYKEVKRKAKSGEEVAIVFDEVSRMSRNADEGFTLYKELYESGISLVFLKEPHINTDTYKHALNRRIELSVNTGREATDKFIKSITDAMNEFLLDLVKEQIRLAFEQAELEVEHLHTRTKEGIEQARLAGKQIGQVKGAKLTTKKSIKAKEQIRKYNKDFEGSLSNEDTYKLIGISRKSFYKYKRELLNE